MTQGGRHGFREPTQLAKEDQSCQSPASTTSPSRSTASPPEKVRHATHHSATPANDCTNGCSPPSGGTRWSASPAAAAASTTPSRSSSLRDRRRDHGCREVRLARMARGPEWKGAWGPNPPFHTPTFILTHHPRPSIEMGGGTTFHFIDASPAEALETAREAADGQDVRLGGGPTMIRDFLPPGSSTTCISWWSPMLLVPRQHASGRPEGLRERLWGRGYLLAERSHACDLHPCGCLNRPLEIPRRPLGPETLRFQPTRPPRFYLA